MWDQLRAWLSARLGSGADASERELADTDPRRAAREAGAAAERAALAHLQSAGLKLIQRNYLARGGELDLVMQDGLTLVFVEVRYRAAGSHGDGIDSVSASKQKRLILAARQFVADHRQYARWSSRFDVVALGDGGLRWLRNAIAVDGASW